MSPQSKREYRETVHLRYKNAPRHEKTAILDGFCAICGCHRKHAIRVLKRFKRFTKPKPGKRGKPPVYQSAAIITPLKEIWLAAKLQNASRSCCRSGCPDTSSSSENSLWRLPMPY